MTDDCTPKPPQDPRADVDARLRGAFEPGDGASARVARAALAAGDEHTVGLGPGRASPRRRGAGLTWLGVAAAAAIVILASTLAWPPSRSVIAPDRAAPPDGPQSLTGSFSDGVLVVSLPDGSVSILGGGARDDRPPDGYGIVLVEGELR